ncbi:hypothetical protein E2C01_086093 [Portunus trituberculatus]|uniref:Uncharacterized protein n=1 Tax=Portunus trituberculatus TaxID=210409 RepID=A0A5B7JDP3_PORTR|nr:hypothetical protein [Portunus trituberculatus]
MEPSRNTSLTSPTQPRH